MICLWCLISVRALYFVKFLVVLFLFLRQRFASCLHGSCYLVGILQLAPPQEITSSVLVNWLGAHIQPELCSDLLQGSCLLFFSFSFFFGLIPSQGSGHVCDFISNLHPSRWNLITQPFSFVTYTHLKDLVMFMASLVIYIYQGRILLLSHFLL